MRLWKACILIPFVRILHPVRRAFIIVRTAELAGEGTPVGNAPPDVAASRSHILERHINLVGPGVPVEIIVLDIVARTGIVSPSVRQVALKHVCGIIAGKHCLYLGLTPPSFVNRSIAIFIERGRIFYRRHGLAISIYGGIA